MKNHRLENITKYVLAIILVFSAIHCGSQNDPGNNSQSVACKPNVIDNGLQLLVIRISASSYSMQVCASANIQGSYSVFGGSSLAAVTPGQMNPNGAVRLKNVKGPAQPGQTIPVSFLDSDTSFSIYVTQDNGNGTISVDPNQPLVSPHSIP